MEDNLKEWGGASDLASVTMCGSKAFLANRPRPCKNLVLLYSRLNLRVQYCLRKEPPGHESSSTCT